MTMSQEPAIKHEAQRDRPATMVVGTSFSSRPMGLGLDGELELRGCDKFALAQLQFAADVAPQPELAQIIRRALQTAQAAGRTWLRFGALLLEGTPGAGRTHLARRLAYLAGLPHAIFDLTEHGTFGSFRDAPQGPDLVLPCAPVVAMAATRCANPVITVLGVEGLDATAQVQLARMIDPDTAGRWVDHTLGGSVDLRQVSWLIQSHVPGQLVRELERLLHPVTLRPPTGADLAVHAAEVLAEAAIDANAPALAAEVVEHMLADLHHCHESRSTAHLYDRARTLIRAYVA
jgi:hypothetical protein